MGTSMAVDMALRTHEIPYIWPQALEQQGRRAEEEGAGRGEKSGRVDLRVAAGAIDGEDARDFDDAVYCEKKHAAAAGDCGSLLLM